MVDGAYASSNGPTRPFYWPDAVKRAIVNRDPIATGMEILRTGEGFRALPVDPVSKRPFPTITPRGYKDATSDPVTFQQWMALMGDVSQNSVAGLGIVVGPQFCVVDDDTGEVPQERFGLGGTFAERTRRPGRHDWYRLPTGRRLRKAKLPDGAGDLLVGESGYVVMAPTSGYTVIDMDAPVLPLPDESPIWELASMRDAVPEHIVPMVNEKDEAKAREIRSRLLRGVFAEGIAALFSGDWGSRYGSESQRDFALLRAATHFLRSDERAFEVLFALLWQTGWPQDRTRSNPKRDPVDYTMRTVARAIRERERADRRRLNRLHAMLVDPLQAAMAERVFDVTPIDSLPPLREGLMRFTCDQADDAFARGDGWRRIPVLDFASVYQVDRQTVWRHLKWLEGQGLLEYDSRPYRHDGKPRKDSLVRCVNRCAGQDTALEQNGSSSLPSGR